MQKSSMPRFVCRLTLLLAAACGCVSMAAAQTPLKKTLPNGLKVLVLENHAAPVVAVRCYVKTGSIYEGQYLGAGISHLFEHVLGEGSTTRTKEQANQEVQSIGGQSNAYTSKDVTAYHITTAASYFPRALASLADMMMNATFPEAEVKTQQGVIHNEMNLGEDDPDRVLYNLFHETAFLAHPVRYPIIGYREVFDRLTREDIVSYYKSHYTPENTIVAVAGDVNAASVFRQVADTFKNWERRSAATPALPDEPRQTTPRRAVVEKDVQLAQMMVGWHTIPLQHPDLYALDTLAQIMGAGASSRLVRELRENKNIVSSIYAYSATPNYNAGIFAIGMTLPAANLDRAQMALWQQIGKVQRDGVTDQELKRAQRQIEASFIFNNSEVEDQAEQMAYDEIGTGDPAYSRRYVARIKAVTAAQVKEVAQKYLTHEGITTAIVRPRTKALAGAAATAGKNRATAPKLMKLANGVRLIVRENHALPTVSIVAMGLGGTRLEPPNRDGVANLTAEMLTRGTPQRTAEQIAALVGSLGGSLDGFSGYNSWGVQSQWLAQDWRKGLSLVQESVQQPTFPEAEIARAKAQVIAAIQQQEDDPETAASLLLRRTFFGSHPYARSALGSVASVKAITRQDLLEYWQRIILGNPPVLAVYGDVNAEEVRRAVEHTFKNLQLEAPKPMAQPPLRPLPVFTVKEQQKPGLAQAVLFFGYPGISVTHPDRYAIDVLDAALSGVNLPGGRLHARLRDNQLVYGVHAWDQPGIERGMFVIYAATTKDNRERVQKIIEEEVQRVKDAPITGEELARAKTMAIAAHAINSQTNQAQAQQAASDELLGLGYNETARYASAINSITVEDVQRVARRYLRPEAAALAVVEPS
ncbi:MAG TPA: pitrilysin family protein [Abditibacteriaceae bacterium]|nr:pitrilysin family protein [Abditibacteriaceae bacterium]